MDYEYWKKTIQTVEVEHLDNIKDSILSDRSMNQEEVDRLLEQIKQMWIAIL